MDDKAEYKRMEMDANIKEHFDRDAFLLDDEVQKYLAIKKDMYNAKREVLKKHGMNWNTFKEMEDFIKDNWHKVGAYVELGEGLIAVGVSKEIRVYQGTGKILDHELRIEIHQKQK